MQDHTPVVEGADVIGLHGKHGRFVACNGVIQTLEIPAEYFRDCKVL